MYPQRSSFNTSELNSAWWKVTSHDSGGDTTVVCSTTGHTFVKTLQHRLGVAVDAKWGPATSTALAAAIRSSNGPAALATAVTADAATRTLRVGSLAAAIWLLHRQSIGDASTGVAASDLSIADDAIPPSWSAAPPTPVVGDTGVIQCVRQRSPAPPNVPANNPAPSPSAPLKDYGGPDVTGIVPDTTTPSSSPGATMPSNLPTGVPAPAPPSGSSITWVAIGVVAAVAVVGTVLAISMTPRSAVSRTPPARQVPERSRVSRRKGPRSRR